jgi:hypothetical protein
MDLLGQTLEQLTDSVRFTNKCVFYYVFTTIVNIIFYHYLVLGGILKLARRILQQAQRRCDGYKIVIGKRDGKMLFERMLRKYGVRMCVGFMRIRIWTTDGFL